jgi:UDP-N-acetylmuramate dehydrogenase
MLLEEYKSLQPLHTFGVTAQARHYSHVPNLIALERLLSLPAIKPLPKLVLGHGSNILFTEDFEGLVVKIGSQAIEKVQENDTHVWLRIDAGLEWHSLVVHCVNQGYSGI